MNNKNALTHLNIDDSSEDKQTRSEKKYLVKTPRSKSIDPYTRPLGEDDDGYHPWQDRPADNPRWEENPWR